MCKRVFKPGPADVIPISQIHDRGCRTRIVPARCLLTCPSTPPSWSAAAITSGVMYDISLRTMIQFNGLQLFGQHTGQRVVTLLCVNSWTTHLKPSTASSSTDRIRCDSSMFILVEQLDQQALNVLVQIVLHSVPSQHGHNHRSSTCSTYPGPVNCDGIYTAGPGGQS